MTTKDSSYKQIIVSMGNDNKTKFMAFSSNHVVNLNKALKNIKSKIMTDYVCSEQIGITIVTITIKVVSSSDLQVIEKYVKNIENIKSEDIETLQLPQLKSYLKIYIPYFMENTNIPIISDFVKSIIKFNHIFNNLLLASKP